MKTEDLINALAEDHAARPQPGSLQWIFVAMALGLTIAAIAFALVLGVRPDVALAMQTWRFDFKLVMTFTLAITSARLVWQSAGQPLTRGLRKWRWPSRPCCCLARLLTSFGLFRNLNGSARHRLQFRRVRPQH